MSNNLSNFLKWFLISSLTNILILIVACSLWTDFEIPQVANIMFWVGAATVIVGLITAGLFVPAANKYSGQTVAIWTTLKHVAPKQQRSTKMDGKEIMRKITTAISISFPSVTLLAISWQMLQ